MNDFAHLEKVIVRELSCRLCLCTDVVKLKPLSSEVKRKLKKLFDINVKADDTLPKAICHDCLQQVSAMHLYAVKIEKTQKFLDFYKSKMNEGKPSPEPYPLQPIIEPLPATAENFADAERKANVSPKSKTPSPPTEHQQGDQVKSSKTKPMHKKKSPLDMKYMESIPLEEFAKEEKVDKSLLNSTIVLNKPSKREISANSINKSSVNAVNVSSTKKEKDVTYKKESNDNSMRNHQLDPIVLVEGRPAKQGAALDKQISLFYKMECGICHENGFHFRSLMKHYKDRHGVPGYVSCCDKKFHYFYPKKIIEHMAFHLQPNIFMCPSCHVNFHTSQELYEHQSNGGRSEGKILCPRCNERFPTYHELGFHIITHRTDKMQCDYCGKQLRHHHRKKTVNRMEDVILCSQCIRQLKSLEKQEKEAKEKSKAKGNEVMQLKQRRFRQAMGLSGDEDDVSTD